VEVFQEALRLGVKSLILYTVSFFPFFFLHASLLSAPTLPPFSPVDFEIYV